MEEMEQADVKALLKQLKLCHLGLSRGGRGYVVPLFYVYDGEYCYFQSHPGLKQEYLAATREACLNAVLYQGPDDWRSVQAFGPVEVLTLTNEIHEAKSALMAIPLPPEPGTFPGGTPRRSDNRVFYWRLKPERIAGMASTKASMRHPAVASSP